MKSNAPMGNRSIPSKIVHPDQVSLRSVALVVNETIDFLDYFIRETEKCCTCNGCARHPRMEFIARNKEEIEEADHTARYCPDIWGKCPLHPRDIFPKTLAQKFQAFREKNGSGKGDRYWKGLEAIAKSHYE